MRYIIYLRVSRDSQEESGLGLDAQRHGCRNWISKQPLQGEILEFTDIITGTDRKRKELTERLGLLEALSNLSAGDVLIVLKRDRLTRDSYLNCLIEREIEKKKATLVCANGEADGDEPHDIFLKRMLDAVAEYEALLISLRTKSALARKKARGERMGTVPYGYSLINKELVINPTELENLRLIYNMRRKKKMSFRDIANEMNNREIKPRLVNRLSTKWTHGSIGRLWNHYPKIK